jgi:site-specific DNA recombinase
MKAAIYCRVSTEEQGVNGSSLDSQQEACLKKANSLGYEIPEGFIFRETFSGLSVDRPQMNILRQKIQNRECDAIIVFSPDRLSRVGEEILNLFKEFKIMGVKIICVNNQWEDSLTGKVIAFMLGWASELEAAQIKERTMRGKRERAKKGFIPQGTGAGLFGYFWDKEKKIRVVNENESRIVETIFERIAKGESRFAVARYLNEMSVPTKSNCKWHPLTIERILTNPAYIGVTHFGKTKSNGKIQEPTPDTEWILMPDATPAIISEELFYKAQRILKRGKEVHRGRPLHDYLLTGYLRCGYCGNPLIGSCMTDKEHQYRYYHCRGAYPTSTRSAICKARYVRADNIENLVWERVNEVVLNPNLVLTDLRRRSKQDKDENSVLNKQINELKRKLQGIENRENRLIKLFSLGTIDENKIQEEMKQLAQAKEEINAKLGQSTHLVKHQTPIGALENQVVTFTEELKVNLQSCTVTEKRTVLDALNVTVVVTDDVLDINLSVPVNSINIESNFQSQYRKSPRERTTTPVVQPIIVY